MSKKDIKFAKLELKMVYSEAFQDLNLAARKILDYTLLQVEWVNTNPKTIKANWELKKCDNMKLLYSTFRKPPFKMHRQSITRGIDSLLGHGFIDIVLQGGAYRGQNSLFKYSDTWENWNKGLVLSKRQPFFARGFLNRHD